MGAVATPLLVLVQAVLPSAPIAPKPRSPSTTKASGKTPSREALAQPYAPHPSLKISAVTCR